MKPYNVLLSGGGLDSAAFTILEAKRIDAIVHVDYGQKAVGGEFQSIEQQVATLNPDIRLIPLRTSDFLRNINPNSLLLGLGDEPFIRGRNLVLVEVTVKYLLQKQIDNKNPLQPIQVNFGLCKEEMMFSDADLLFINTINTMYQISYGQVKADDPQFLVNITAPFISIFKTHYLANALYYLRQAGKSENVLWDAFTCWTPTSEGKECLECYHCKKKMRLKVYFNLTAGDL